jgi:glycosyltransferase involved in cell wall biosynthesis
MKGTTIVVPAFNEARTIATVLADLHAQAPERIIVVDDGSTDQTAARVRAQIAAAMPGGAVELLRHPANLGKGFALASGIAHALALGTQRVITFDGDGQHTGADILRLEQIAARDPEALVIAARTRNRGRSPPLRRFANATADFWISWACGRRIDDTQSGFRLYPAALLARLPTRPRRGHGFAFETELLIDAVAAGATPRYVPIATLYPEHGRASHYRPWGDTWSIILLVAGRLIRRGMYPSGLLRSLGAAPAESGGAGA